MKSVPYNSIPSAAFFRLPFAMLEGSKPCSGFSPFFQTIYMSFSIQAPSRDKRGQTTGKGSRDGMAQAGAKDFSGNPSQHSFLLKFSNRALK